MEAADAKKPRREIRPPAHLYTDVADMGASSPRHGAPTANHDLCDACGDGGSLLCCDSCPCSFHLMCVDPPLKEVPPGDWFCNQCRSHDPAYVEAIPPSMKGNKYFSTLMQRLRVTNPHAYSLSSELVAAVTRDEEGGRSGPPSVSDNDSESRPNDAPSLSRPIKERRRRMVHKDAHLCRICGQSSKPLLRCSVCGRSYHLYCLDPPLVSLPSRPWFCPEHPGYLQQRSHVLGERTVSLSFMPLGARPDRRKPFPHRAPKRLPTATDEPHASPPRSPQKPAAASSESAAQDAQEGAAEESEDEEAKSLANPLKDGEYVLALQNLQQQLANASKIETYPDGESFLARARAKARQRAQEEQAVEVARLKALEEALLPSAFPGWVATAENSDVVNVPPAVVSHLSPLFVQFLAWQRLVEISHQLAALPSAASLPTTAPVPPPVPAPASASVPRKQPLPRASSPVLERASAAPPTKRLKSAAPPSSSATPAPPPSPSVAHPTSTTTVSVPGISSPAPSSTAGTPATGTMTEASPEFQQAIAWAKSVVAPPAAPTAMPAPKAKAAAVPVPKQPAHKAPAAAKAAAATQRFAVSAYGEPDFRLTSLDGGGKWDFSPVKLRPTVEIGRRRNVEAPDAMPLHVNLNDLPGNSLVSRRQASITWSRDQKMHILTNWGRNGTTVGMDKLIGEKSAPLRDGTVIKIGKINLRYNIVRPDGGIYITATDEAAPPESATTQAPTAPPAAEHSSSLTQTTNTNV